MRKFLRVPLAPMVNGVGRMFDRSQGVVTKTARTLAVAAIVAMSAVTLPAPSVHAQNDALVAEAVSEYFVYFIEPGAAKYEGNIAGFSRTAPIRSGTKFDADRVEVTRYRAHLDELQTQRIADIESALGRSLNVEYRYTILNSGIVVSMGASEAQNIAALPYVRSVEIVKDYELDTDRGPWFIGADQIWSGDASPSGTGYRGQDMVIGVIDTGINTVHPSFANDASCGFSASNPKLVAFKDCLGSATCEGASPIDANGHGSHTASTAGGNTHVATGGDLQGTTISGIAPCAKIISYKVCPTNSCDGAAIQAAIETALVDQVDAVNYSISGGQSPWTDADRGFLDLVDGGIFVAASAGNTSTGVPNPIGQVNHRGPWVMTVANSTHDRISKNRVDVAGGPQDVYGLKSAAAMPNDVSATVADSGALGNLLGCTAGGGFPAGSMTGDIALISRGDCTFEEKINNAIAAGAIAVMVRNNNAGPPIAMGLGTATGVPSVMVPQAEGQAISTFVVANPTAVATIDSTTVVALDPIAGDVLSPGSLRGPIAGGIEVTKPDITGPGTNIMAAVSGGATSYGFLSGTSMSSPHVAGSGALVKGTRPNWTVQEVKSAIQMTAFKDGLKDFVNGTPNNGPWDADDVGNGRVDLSKAALAGLVMNETTANYLAANGSQANQRALNIPSVRNTVCTPNCTFTRTVRNTLEGPSSWSVSADNISAGFTLEVSPTSFSFDGTGIQPADAIFIDGFEVGGAGEDPETQTITITATPTTNMTVIGFGEVVFVEDDGRSPDLHITAAVLGNGGAGAPDINVTPTSVSGTGEEGGSVVTAPLTIANVGGSPLNWSEGTTRDRGATVIWDQPQAGTNGIVSDFSIAQNGGAYTANDFVLTSSATLASIRALGFDNSNTLAAQTEITWEIYPDAAGSPAGNPQTAPGAAVWSFSAAPTNPAVDITANNIELDLVAAGETVELAPGTYWLTVFPTYTGNITAGTDPRWNWFQAAVVGTGSKLIAPNLFGNITTWTLTGAGGLGTAINDTAFTITGTTGGGAVCGADWLSISPTSGTVAPAGNQAVTVSMDPDGLDPGSYEANLCIDSNDPDEAQVVVPVTFDVEEGGGPGGALIDEDFEAGFPVGWTAVNSGSTSCPWLVPHTGYPMTGLSGTVSPGAGVDSDDCGVAGMPIGGIDTSLVAPVMDLSAATGTELNFDVAYRHVTGGRLDLDVTTDGGTTWVNLRTWGATTGGTSPNIVGVPTTVDLGAYDGEASVQLRWRYFTGWHWFAYVDNVVVTAEIGGPDPDIVVMDNVNFTPNADFTGGAINWLTGATCACDTAPNHFNIWSSGGTMTFFFPVQAPVGTFGAVADGGGNYAVLAPGAVIGPASTFAFGSASPSTANWRQAANVNGYLGFRFQNTNTGQVNFGYARITTTGTNGFPATIVSYAYNQAGNPITIP